MRRLALVVLAPLAFGLAACNTKEAPQPPASTSASVAESVTPVTPPPPMTTSPIAVPPKVDFARYTNPRFGFAVDYPTFIKLEPPTANGDGQTFSYFDKILMKAWAVRNADDTIETRAKHALAEQVDPKDDPKKAITSQVKTADGFVISGTRGSKIFYRKEKVVKGIAYGVLLEYDASSKAEMDPIVAHVAESFVVTGGSAPTPK
jgi:hypothetical protein